jgi:hypothetical protein
MVDPAAFVRDGFVRVDGAFPADLAGACRALLWEQLEERPDDPTTWTRPAARLGYQDAEPFARAVDTERLHQAFDLLVGRGRWAPRADLGTFVVRFPSGQPPGDDGWHLDGSFPPLPPDDADDQFAWRVNLASRGRTLLMLFLFSDVGEDDAPTRLRVGSHRDVARLLAPHGEDGLTMLEASLRGADASADRPVALATGRAGDVYLCHPFLVHAAQAHRGREPRFLVQPPLHPRAWLDGCLDLADATVPVARAIVEALGDQGDGGAAPSTNGTITERA